MPDSKEEASRSRGVARSVWLLEHLQDLVSVIVGGVLIALAAAELVSGIVDFFTGIRKSGIEAAGISVLDRVLLVLILIEIVHTVVLSLRARRPSARAYPPADLRSSTAVLRTARRQPSYGRDRSARCWAT